MTVADLIDVIRSNVNVWGAGKLAEVMYLFSEGCEIQKVREGAVISTYFPNPKIKKRLENESPLSIVYVFKKFGFTTARLVIKDPMRHKLQLKEI